MYTIILIMIVCYVALTIHLNYAHVKLNNDSMRCSTVHLNKVYTNLNNVATPVAWKIRRMYRTSAVVEIDTKGRQQTHLFAISQILEVTCAIRDRC